MGLVSPSQSNSGDTIEASDINNPVNQLAAVINGGIDANNITDSSITNAKVAAGLSSSKLANPYKFSVYRAAAHTSATSASPVLFDTKSYDTGTNVDVVTNKGRFTAPIAGFYHFSARAGNTAASGVPTFAFLYKNGARVKSGSGAISSPTGSFSTVSADVQLVANDYIEVYFVGGSGSTMDVTPSECYFDGHLISAT